MIDSEKTKGFRVNYSKIKDSIHRCEIEMADKKSRDNCRRIFKELNIDIVDE